MAIPEKREDLLAMGYVFDNEATCRGCGEPVEWWITPKSKKMPMSVLAIDTKGEIVPQGSLTRPHEFVRRTHFSLCPNAADFRKKQ